jgi:hypothetical protein
MGFSPDMIKKGAESATLQLRGSLSHLPLGAAITEEDIREARQEAWGNFPREDKQIWGDYLKETNE